MYTELRQQLGGGELVELPAGGVMRLEVRGCNNFDMVPCHMFHSVFSLLLLCL